MHNKFDSSMIKLMSKSNFLLLPSFWYGVGGWVCGRVPCPCMHTHAHACMYIHVKHDNLMQMAVPMGKSLGKPYDVIMHVCMHMHVFTCMHA